MNNECVNNITVDMNDDGKFIAKRCGQEIAKTNTLPQMLNTLDGWFPHKNFEIVITRIALRLCVEQATYCRAHRATTGETPHIEDAEK